METGDGLIVVLIALVLGAWLFIYVRGKLKESLYPLGIDIPAHEPVNENEVTNLLTAHGYEVISGKQRIPIEITVNEDEPLGSRLFIDYFAEKDGIYYTVKIAKERKPLEMTGSSLRDRLLIYHLVYPQTAGVLYVELNQRKINIITFELHAEEVG
ncbi:hypothetical protein [Paenibacillus xerothermodurans]|uniref:Uncharacterized protein n=1 Tax=Paenibacillus xerothermodurans TaxID=1977292 RepID=A0A2W1NTT1_PAEXE|nr:hypothetical protein [Paenibacillus xerothermodurans]PZE22043.1 hypothetical protein CBW46_006505 [Paenibacillus xerothermodurans]